MIANTFLVVEEWRDQNVTDLVFKLPPGISSEDDLFAVYDRGLGFPSYFGFNWGAFDECICDRSWIDNSRVVVLHEDIPLSDTSEQRIYLEILQGAVLNLNVRTGPDIPGAPDLIAIFPGNCARRIEELLQAPT